MFCFLITLIQDILVLDVSSSLNNWIIYSIIVRTLLPDFSKSDSIIIVIWCKYVSHHEITKVRYILADEKNVNIVDMQVAEKQMHT